MWKGTNVLVIASKQKKIYLKQSETCVISVHREEIVLEKMHLEFLGRYLYCAHCVQIPPLHSSLVI